MPEVDKPDSTEEFAALKTEDSVETAVLTLAGISVTKLMLNRGCWSLPQLDMIEEKPEKLLEIKQHHLT